MPMLTVYAGDPSLRMRCNETRRFTIVPDPTMNIYNRRVFETGIVKIYHRLNWYGLKGGHAWEQKGLLSMTHYMTECINHTAYFKNSV